MRHFLTILTFLLITLSSNSTSANVGVFEGYGHTIELTKTEAIEMVSEEVTIIPGRGRFIFDGGIAGMDRVEYICEFKLKNLTSDTVDIQVGFPLNAESLDYRLAKDTKTSELVASYNFLAQEEGNIYSVRYSQGDKKLELENLFTWDMIFEPLEEKELLITYSMPISMTLALTSKNYEFNYSKEWYNYLEQSIMELFGYVTETGKSWSGPIRKAVFRVYTKGFEEYINNRPSEEGMSEEEKKKSFERYPVLNPITFRITEPEKWIEDENEEGFIKLTYENYEAEDNLMIYYYISFFPKYVDDARRLITLLSKDGFESDDYEDLRDILLEFNGTKTGNKRIRKFLKNQIWYKDIKHNLIPNDVIEFVEDQIEQE